MRSAEAHALLFEGLACCFIVFPTWLELVRAVSPGVGEGLWGSWGRRVGGGAGLVVGPDVHDAVGSRVV